MCTAVSGGSTPLSGVRRESRLVAPGFRPTGIRNRTAIRLSRRSTDPRADSGWNTKSASGGDGEGWVRQMGRALQGIGPNSAHTPTGLYRDDTGNDKA